MDGWNRACSHPSIVRPAPPDFSPELDITRTNHATRTARQNELDEPFLWLPNLEGPTYGAGPTDGMNWLTKGWEGLQPSLGWHDTIAFLTIPLILIVSQSISQKILQPPGAKDDPVRAHNSGVGFGCSNGLSCSCPARRRRASGCISEQARTY